MTRDPFKIQQNTVKDRKLNDFNIGEAAGDNFLFMPALSGWLGKNLKQKTIGLYYIFLLILFITLMSKIVYLQVIHGAEYRSRAEGNRSRTYIVHAPRGLILDKYHRPLMHNISRFFLYIDFNILQQESDREGLKLYLSNQFPESRSQIDQIFDTSVQHNLTELLVEDLAYEDAIRTMIKTSQYPSLIVSYEPRREYLYSNGLEHVLGYVGKVTEDDLIASTYAFTDQIGKKGLEQYYDSILRGNNGSIQFEVDAFGRKTTELASLAATSGKDLVITIDIDIQEKLYEVLLAVSRTNSSKPAAGIVSDPRTGEILAMVSLPGYDANIFSSSLNELSYAKLLDDPNKPLFNRVIAGRYPPGSIFKMSVAAAALEEGVINDLFYVVSTGGVLLGDRFFPDWKAGGHGTTNIYKAIAESVNTFFYIVGGGDNTTVGLGAETIAKYATSFGLDRLTDIDMPGEVAGFIPTRAEAASRDITWYQGDTYNLAIGQGALITTPIAIQNYLQYFISDATIPKLHLARLDNTLTGSTANFLSVKTKRMVQQAMRDTVVYGTAQSMQSINAAVAGKTGTAQFSNNKSPHSWFTGYAPYNDPEIALTIMIEEGGDSNLAITASRKFLQWYFNLELDD